MMVRQRKGVACRRHDHSPHLCNPVLPIMMASSLPPGSGSPLPAPRAQLI